MILSQMDLRKGTAKGSIDLLGFALEVFCFMDGNDKK